MRATSLVLPALLLTGCASFPSPESARGPAPTTSSSTTGEAERRLDQESVLIDGREGGLGGAFGLADSVHVSMDL